MFIIIGSVINCLSEVKAILLTKLEELVFEFSLRRHHEKIRSFDHGCLHLPKKMIVQILLNWLIKVSKVQVLVYKGETEAQRVQVFADLRLTFAGDKRSFRIAFQHFNLQVPEPS